MSNFITVSRTDSAATHAQRLLQVIQQKKQAINDEAQLIREMYQMFGADGPEKFAELATKFGLETAADGNTVFDMMNGSQQEMRGYSGAAFLDNTQTMALINRVG